MGRVRDYGGRPRHYSDLKRKHTLTLTDTAWEKLDILASLLGLTRSDFVERLGRGTIAPIELQDIYKKFVDRG